MPHTFDGSLGGRPSFHLETEELDGCTPPLSLSGYVASLGFCISFPEAVLHRETTDQLFKFAEPCSAHVGGLTTSKITIVLHVVLLASLGDGVSCYLIFPRRLDLAFSGFGFPGDLKLGLPAASAALDCCCFSRY
jgi:hypothetical protein